MEVLKMPEEKEEKEENEEEIGEVSVWAKGWCPKMPWEFAKKVEECQALKERGELKELR